MPLMTEEEFDNILDDAGVAGKMASDILRDRLVGFYERMISAGDLLIVKRPDSKKEDTPPKQCPRCGASF